MASPLTPFQLRRPVILACAMSRSKPDRASIVLIDRVLEVGRAADSEPEPSGQSTKDMVKYERDILAVAFFYTSANKIYFWLTWRAARDILFWIWSV